MRPMLRISRKSQRPFPPVRSQHQSRSPKGHLPFASDAAQVAALIGTSGLPLAKASKIRGLGSRIFSIPREKAADRHSSPKRKRGPSVQASLEAGRRAWLHSGGQAVGIVLAEFVNEIGWLVGFEVNGRCSWRC
ncbi:hypothetical protein CISG_05830 [Coccidioides immitis RMSCC 3703]|uniref:Uncharacterized protein n=1 Tax=Coccidioides immitis RMSCC 3703 TaxID=454286 RepID=A0A0J8TSF2_COCIT|nr:hypothetical protein CISG_05830 [Coccidioides immitis RMSCC 3703]